MHYLGQIQLFPYGYAPRGWELCKGQPCSTMTFVALFDVLGYNYGGSVPTIFDLPNLRNAAPYTFAIGEDEPLCAYYIAMIGDYPSRN